VIQKIKLCDNAPLPSAINTVPHFSGVVQTLNSILGKVPAPLVHHAKPGFQRHSRQIPRLGRLPEKSSL